MAFDHDKRYKKLFSDPVLIKQLLITFVKESFIQKLDFSKIERLDKSFVTDEFKEKESDLIYKINIEGSDIYIYLLLEFQSTVDKYISIRMGRYIYEFLEVQSKKNPDKLSPVFPLLLYNGDAQWTAPVTTAYLMNDLIPEKYIPNFEYYPIIINKISKDSLLKFNNAVSAVFYVENSSIEELVKEFNNVIVQIEKENPQTIFAFRNWINNFLGNYNPEINEKILQTQQEFEMFATSVENLKKREREQGQTEAKLEDARRMKELGIETETIIKVTGLSIEELKKVGIFED